MSIRIRDRSRVDDESSEWQWVRMGQYKECLLAGNSPSTLQLNPSCQLIDLHITNTTSALLVGASQFLIPLLRRLSVPPTLMLLLMTSPLWGCQTSSLPINEWLVVVWIACCYQATLKSSSLGVSGLVSREGNPTTQSLRPALAMLVLLPLLLWMRWPLLMRGRTRGWRG